MNAGGGSPRRVHDVASRRKTQLKMMVEEEAGKPHRSKGGMTKASIQKGAVTQGKPDPV